MVDIDNAWSRQGGGQAFLDMAWSVYPGSRAEPTLAHLVVGAAFGLVDGALFGAVPAWPYNRFAVAA